MRAEDKSMETIVNLAYNRALFIQDRIFMVV